MTDAIRARLEALSADEAGFSTAGGLCLALILTRRIAAGLPMDREKLVSRGGGQVTGLQPEKVQRILEDHGIGRVLHKSAGRTNPASLGLMNTYVALLNDLHGQGILTTGDLGSIEDFWIARVRDHFIRHPDESGLIRIRLPEAGPFSPSAILRGILAHADAMRTEGSGGPLDAAMRLLAAASVPTELRDAAHFAMIEDAGRPSYASYDFRVADASFHVASVPGEQMVERCRAERRRGRLPVVLTSPEGVVAARMMFRRAGHLDGYEVHDLVDWLASGLLREGFLSTAGSRAALAGLLARYGELAAATPALGAPAMDASALEKAMDLLV